MNKGKSILRWLTLTRKKIIASAVLGCFLFSISFAQYVPSISGAANVTIQNSLALKNLMLDPEQGRVIDRFKGKDDKVVICIQDLHCNAEVQNNISEIISNLKESYNKGIKNIFVEGAWTKLNLDFIRSVPNETQKIRSSFIESLINQGRVTGQEKYAIVKDLDVNLIGIENKNLYIKDRELLIESFETRDNAVKFLDIMTERVNKDKKKYYSPSLVNFEKQIEKYNAGKMNIVKYLELLKNYATRLNIDFSEFENISKLMSLINLYQRLAEEEAIKMQAQELIVRFEDIISDEEKTKLSTLKEQNINRFYLYLASIIQRENIYLSSEYSILDTYLKYLNLSATLNTEQLVEEDIKLQGDIKFFLSDNIESKKLVELDEIITLKKNFLSNAISSKKSDIFLTDAKSVNQKIYDFINSNSSDVLWFAEMKSLFKDLVKTEELMRKFYITAKDRNTALIRNTLKHKNKVSVMVVGGYHTKGLTEILKTKGVSYILISPNIKNDHDNSIYNKIIKEQAQKPGTSTLAAVPLWTATDVTPELSQGVLAEMKKLYRALGLSEEDTKNSIEENFNLVKQHYQQEGKELPIDLSIQIANGEIQLVEKGKVYAKDVFDEGKGKNDGWFGKKKEQRVAKQSRQTEEQVRQNQQRQIDESRRMRDEDADAEDSDEEEGDLKYNRFVKKKEVYLDDGNVHVAKKQRADKILFDGKTKEEISEIDEDSDDYSYLGESLMNIKKEHLQEYKNKLDKDLKGERSVIDWLISQREDIDNFIKKHNVEEEGFIQSVIQNYNRLLLINYVMNQLVAGEEYQIIDSRDGDDDDEYIITLVDRNDEIYTLKINIENEDEFLAESDFKKKMEQVRAEEKMEDEDEDAEISSEIQGKIDGAIVKKYRTLHEDMQVISTKEMNVSQLDNLVYGEGVIANKYRVLVGWSNNNKQIYLDVFHIGKNTKFGDKKGQYKCVGSFNGADVDPVSGAPIWSKQVDDRFTAINNQIFGRGKMSGWSCGWAALATSLYFQTGEMFYVEQLVERYIYFLELLNAPDDDQKSNDDFRTYFGKDREKVQKMFMERMGVESIKEVFNMFTVANDIYQGQAPFWANLIFLVDFLGYGHQALSFNDETLGIFDEPVTDQMPTSFGALVGLKKSLGFDGGIIPNGIPVMIKLDNNYILLVVKVKDELILIDAHQSLNESLEAKNIIVQKGSKRFKGYELSNIEEKKDEDSGEYYQKQKLFMLYRSGKAKVEGALTPPLVDFGIKELFNKRKLAVTSDLGERISKLVSKFGFSNKLDKGRTRKEKFRYSDKYDKASQGRDLKRKKVFTKSTRSLPRLTTDPKRVIQEEKREKARTNWTVNKHLEDIEKSGIAVEDKGGFDFEKVKNILKKRKSKKSIRRELNEIEKNENKNIAKVIYGGTTHTYYIIALDKDGYIKKAIILNLGNHPNQKVKVGDLLKEIGAGTVNDQNKYILALRNINKNVDSSRKHATKNLRKTGEGIKSEEGHVYKGDDFVQQVIVTNTIDTELIDLRDAIEREIRALDIWIEAGSRELNSGRVENVPEGLAQLVQIVKNLYETQKTNDNWMRNNGPTVSLLLMDLKLAGPTVTINNESDFLIKDNHTVYPATIRNNDITYDRTIQPQNIVIDGRIQVGILNTYLLRHYRPAEGALSAVLIKELFQKFYDSLEVFNDFSMLLGGGQFNDQLLCDYITQTYGREANPAELQALRQLRIDLRNHLARGDVNAFVTLLNNNTDRIERLRNERQVLEAVKERKECGNDGTCWGYAVIFGLMQNYHLYRQQTGNNDIIQRARRLEQLLNGGSTLRFIDDYNMQEPTRNMRMVNIRVRELMANFYDTPNGKALLLESGMMFYDTYRRNNVDRLLNQMFGRSEYRNIYTQASSLNREAFQAWWTNTGHDYYVREFSGGKNYSSNVDIHALAVVLGMRISIRGDAYHNEVPDNGAQNGAVYIYKSGIHFQGSKTKQLSQRRDSSLTSNPLQFFKGLANMGKLMFTRNIKERDVIDALEGQIKKKRDTDLNLTGEQIEWLQKLRKGLPKINGEKKHIRIVVSKDKEDETALEETELGYSSEAKVWLLTMADLEWYVMRDKETEGESTEQLIKHETTEAGIISGKVEESEGEDEEDIKRNFKEVENDHKAALEKDPKNAEYIAQEKILRVLRAALGQELKKKGLASTVRLKVLKQSIAKLVDEGLMDRAMVEAELNKAIISSDFNNTSIIIDITNKTKEYVASEIKKAGQGRKIILMGNPNKNYLNDFITKDLEIWRELQLKNGGELEYLIPDYSENKVLADDNMRKAHQQLLVRRSGQGGTRKFTDYAGFVVPCEPGKGITKELDGYGKQFFGAKVYTEGTKKMLLLRLIQAMYLYKSILEDVENEEVAWARFCEMNREVNGLELGDKKDEFKKLVLIKMITEQRLTDEDRGLLASGFRQMFMPLIKAPKKKKEEDVMKDEDEEEEDDGDQGGLGKASGVMLAMPVVKVEEEDSLELKFTELVVDQGIINSEVVKSEGNEYHLQIQGEKVDEFKELEGLTAFDRLRMKVQSAPAKVREIMFPFLKQQQEEKGYLTVEDEKNLEQILQSV